MPDRFSLCPLDRSQEAFKLWKLPPLTNLRSVGAFITPMSRTGLWVPITIVHGVYKPSNITGGGPHCSVDFPHIQMESDSHQSSTRIFFAPEKGRKGCLHDGFHGTTPSWMVQLIPSSNFFSHLPFMEIPEKKNVVSFRGCLILPICSMVLEYLPTKLGDF